MYFKLIPGKCEITCALFSFFVSVFFKELKIIRNTFKFSGMLLCNQDVTHEICFIFIKKGNFVLLNLQFLTKVFFCEFGK